MDKNPTLPILEENPLFAVLTAEERVLLWKSAVVHTYSRHQVLYKPGQPASKVYFLLQGIVKVTVHAEKKDIKPTRMIGNNQGL